MARKAPTNIGTNNTGRKRIQNGVTPGPSFGCDAIRSNSTPMLQAAAIPRPAPTTSPVTMPTIPPARPAAIEHATDATMAIKQSMFGKFMKSVCGGAW